MTITKMSDILETMDEYVYLAVEECILQFSRPQRGATPIGNLAAQGTESKNLIPISNREDLFGRNFKVGGRKEGLKTATHELCLYFGEDRGPTSNANRLLLFSHFGV